MMTKSAWFTFWINNCPWETENAWLKAFNKQYATFCKTEKLFIPGQMKDISKQDNFKT